ncbi:unnamed protein product, partial [marine sediment metagenome]
MARISPETKKSLAGAIGLDCAFGKPSTLYGKIFSELSLVPFFNLPVPGCNGRRSDSGYSKDYGRWCYNHECLVCKEGLRDDVGGKESCRKCRCNFSGCKACKFKYLYKNQVLQLKDIDYCKYHLQDNECVIRRCS